MRNLKSSLIIIMLLVLSPSVLSQALEIGLVNQDPDPVTAGDVVQVKIKIENLWQTTKDRVIVEIKPEYPFSLYSGTGKKDVGVIKGNQFGSDAQIIDFRLKVDDKAVEGDHPLDFIITIGDTEWKYNDIFFVDIKNEEIRFRAYIRNSDIIIPGTKGKFSIEFANAGGYDLEFLELELLPSDDYKLLSTSTYTYIGELESDDTESEEFQIYVPKDVEVVNIPIMVKYEANDYLYESQENLKLELLTKEEAKNIGLIEVSYAPYIWAGVIIGIILILLFRKFKKKR